MGGDKTTTTPAKGAAKGPAKTPAKGAAKSKGPSKTSALAEKIKAQQAAKKKIEEEEERLRQEQLEAQRQLDLQAEREEAERVKRHADRAGRDKAQVEERRKKAEDDKRIKVLQRLGADVDSLPTHNGTGKVVRYADKKKHKPVEAAPVAVETAPAPEPDAPAEDWEDEIADDWETAAEESETPEPAPPVTEEDKNKGKSVEEEVMVGGGAGASLSKAEMRSPIICVLGHVDSGKTKILDTIRHTKVGDGEAGGITQQIGATFLPSDALIEKTHVLHKGKHSMSLPGLLVIDTPGHESFSNLRVRGSSLCDMAILVVDVLSGLEPQTIESIKLLQKQNIPFVVALNKIDRLTGYTSLAHGSSRANLKQQNAHTFQHYTSLFNSVFLQFANAEVNVAPYWERKPYPDYISVVPTSAHTGEGIPDLLAFIVTFCQNVIPSKLILKNDAFNCTVLEVKAIEGLGTTIDVLLVDGQLTLGDEILLCGFDGPIRAKVRALLTPQPLREMRVKSQYLRHSTIRAAMGVKISADGLDGAVAGSQVHLISAKMSTEELKTREAEVMKGLTDLFRHVRDNGVSVQASTLGALEALLNFLHDIKIPVGQVNIGTVHRKHVMGAMVYLDREVPRKDLACILAFDVKIDKDAALLAEQQSVRIFTSDVIYHLEEMYVRYLKELKEEAKRLASALAVFPAKMVVVPDGVFRDKNPILLGVEVQAGWLQMGAPLCVIPDGSVHNKDKAKDSKDSKKDDSDEDDEEEEGRVLSIGRVAGIQKDNTDVVDAKTGDKVAIKVQSDRSVQVGRHFSGKETIYVEIKRENIECLKEHYREELKEEVLKLIPLIKEVKSVLRIE